MKEQLVVPRLQARAVETTGWPAVAWAIVLLGSFAAMAVLCYFSDTLEEGAEFWQAVGVGVFVCDLALRVSRDR